VIGTASPAAITLTPSRARSSAEAIPAGFDVGTITVRRLPANGVGFPSARPLSASRCGLPVSADRNRSAGAPSSILASSAAEESVEMVSEIPGVASS
jgi:hypothetical protein